MIDENENSLLRGANPEDIHEGPRDLKPSDPVKVIETGDLAVITEIEDDGTTDNKIIHVEFTEGEKAGTTDHFSENDLELAA